MKIVFFSNFINHHQVHLSDALYNETDSQFFFVQTMPMPESFKKSGYPDYSSRSYVIDEYKDSSAKEQALELALNADVMIIGSAPIWYEVARARQQKSNQLTFEYSERALKMGWINLLSPQLIKSQFFYHTLFYKKPVFKLCASAFTAVDMRKLHSFRDRCFKWGYFTTVDGEKDFKTLKEGVAYLMWCARFLAWKHPEMPIQLAKMLKNEGYRFVLDMYGNGKYLSATKKLAKKLQVEDVVNFCGNIPNQDILKAMSKHDIFLFTSDRNEGWGAVLNEAMSNGCVPVASDAIGSVPFLIEEGENGLTFESKSLESLYKGVKMLLDKPNVLEQMSINACETMKNVWSPVNAARNFIQLCEALRNNGEIPLIGPCSKVNY